MMSTLDPRQRADIVKQVKDLDRKIQDPRLSIARVDEMHHERARLRAILLADRAGSS
jgi:hypothetical protein